MQIPPLQIRHLTEISEFQQVLDLQREIWQMSDLEIQPTDTFAVADKTGGVTLGAFLDERLVGFSLGLPAIKDDGTPFLHSHMLGVLPPFSNRGIGRALKLQQRDWALGRKIELIEWTFDPLQTKNTFFNVERLGALVRRCYRNFYGKTSNAWDAGFPTDRCVAEWWLASARVHHILAQDAGPEAVTIVHEVEVAADTQEMRRSDPVRFRELQCRLMEQLSLHFARGLAILQVKTRPKSALYRLGPARIDLPPK